MIPHLASRLPTAPCASIASRGKMVCTRYNWLYNQLYNRLRRVYAAWCRRACGRVSEIDVVTECSRWLSDDMHSGVSVYAKQQPVSDVTRCHDDRERDRVCVCVSRWLLAVTADRSRSTSSSDHATRVDVLRYQLQTKARSTCARWEHRGLTIRADTAEPASTAAGRRSDFDITTNSQLRHRDAVRRAN